ncbi:UPF0280 family protein [Hoeflea sp.]|uniref:UPF0280 family protein n=1 Tax=Hoeflea sp. TaxID=1940281 RepID=UPI00374A74FE
MQGPVAAYLDDRLHLQHGPIDLIIGVDGDAPDCRTSAFEAAALRFGSVLEELVSELPLLRRALSATLPRGAVARRMHAAARPFAHKDFLTPMIAVAGSVADEILAAMRDAVPMRRAYVNNGGDIAVHLAPAESFRVAVSGADGASLGDLQFDGTSAIGGIATSGARGRSFSLGIADSVTVIARDAASADAAATLIANAVDLPGNSSIRRQAADELQPDSDLGRRLVVTQVPQLSLLEKRRALEAGLARAETMRQAGRILGAALFLQGQSATTGSAFATHRILEDVHG